METFVLGDPSRFFGDFLVLFVIGLMMAGLTYALCAFPSLRRAELREGGAYRGLGLILAFFLVAGFSFAGAWPASHRFTRLSYGEQTVRLFYSWPEREIDIPCDRIRGVDYVVDNPKSGTFELAVLEKNGRVHRSAGMPRRVFEPLYKEVRDLICP